MQQQNNINGHVSTPTGDNHYQRELILRGRAERKGQQDAVLGEIRRHADEHGFLSDIPTAQIAATLDISWGHVYQAMMVLIDDGQLWADEDGWRVHPEQVSQPGAAAPRREIIAFQVLDALRKHANPDGRIHIYSLTRIAEDTNATEDDVADALDALLEHGVIKDQDDYYQLPGYSKPEPEDAYPVRVVPEFSADDRPAYDLAWVIATVLGAHGLLDYEGGKLHSFAGEAIQSTQGIIFVYIRDYMTSYEDMPRGLNLPNRNLR